MRYLAVSWNKPFAETVNCGDKFYRPHPQLLTDSREPALTKPTRARLTMTAQHLQQRREICSFSEALWIDVGWLQGMTESASWSLREVLIRLLEAFQWRIPASAKKGLRR